MHTQLPRLVSMITALYIEKTSVLYRMVNDIVFKIKSWLSKLVKGNRPLAEIGSGERRGNQACALIFFA